MYGALVEFAGFTCPLTLLENSLRRRSGQAGYRGGFIAYYLVPVIYPPGLTREMQIGLGRLGAAGRDQRIPGLPAPAYARPGVARALAVGRLIGHQRQRGA